MGMTPQSGIFHNNRVGDFDAFAIPRLTARGSSNDEIFRQLSKHGGLLGISGVSNDLRDIEAASDSHADPSVRDRCRLAIDAFVESVRNYLGAYLVALGGVDLIAFTGGIGENAARIRAATCERLDFAGVRLDAVANQGLQTDQTRGREVKISSAQSTAHVWIIPTNEELIVARQTADVLGRTASEGQP
jgi:acetate kinase